MGAVMRYQPQGLVRIAKTNPLARGLGGYWTPTSNTAKPIAGATKAISPQGVGFTTISATDYWLASDVAIASNNATWTILAVLSGVSTNNPSFGVAFYSERPNDTQIVKLGMGDGGTNTAMLVVRDQQGNLVLQHGNVDVRTDTGKPRVIVGVRRSTSDHRLYVDGRFDAASVASVSGTFGPTNAGIGNDPGDTRSYLTGASLPLILVWNRALTDVEIAQISANPWQLFDSGSASSTYQSAIASKTATGGTTDTGTLSWTEANDGTSLAANVSDPTTITWIESNDTYAVSTVFTDRATVSYTEGDDAYLVGVSVAGGGSTMTWTESNDAYSIQGVIYDPANITWTEANDVYGTTVVIQNVATPTWTEANDTMVLAAVSKDFGSIAWAETDDGVAFLPSPNVGSGRRRKGIHK